MKEIDLRVEGMFSKRVWVLYLVGLPFFLSAAMLGLILGSEFHPALFLVVVFISEPLFRIIYVSTYNKLCYKFKEFPTSVFIKRIVMYQLILIVAYYGVFKAVVHVGP